MPTFEASNYKVWISLCKIIKVVHCSSSLFIVPQICSWMYNILSTILWILLRDCILFYNVVVYCASIHRSTFYCIYTGWSAGTDKNYLLITYCSGHKATYKLRQVSFCPLRYIHFVSSFQKICHCVCHIAFVILHLSNFFFNIALVTLHCWYWIVILHSSYWICHIAYVTLHLSYCICPKAHGLFVMFRLDIVYHKLCQAHV